ncbi:hypothetical protein A1O1_07285 [Capronia coronata CBS 617.96]|uniref:AB hydrolase-1 domain-containing protein n=1 Tax=Capronia coronata CBS 617.96 TaxID=1182541 RepID=W9Y338_9EURO|nr:uncharacterized protein A1O1_07285 [Capronia coronata CBS 617.96]EXJ83661.1 hypothetical protein A1O1_07285 [Capronia coronata CBS 617.96]
MASKAHLCSATTWGSPLAPKTAVLIHGLSSNSQCWVTVAPELVKQGYYVIAPDLLGHGLAARSNTYERDDLVEDILPQVSHRYIDLLIGHSLGGPVSLGLYPHLKTKPKRFVLVDPVSSHPLHLAMSLLTRRQSHSISPHKLTPHPQALELSESEIEVIMRSDLENIKTRTSPQQFQERFPSWDPVTCVVKSMAVALADAEAVEYIGTKYRPWSCTKDLPPAASDGVEMVIIGADPLKDAVFKPAQADALARSHPDIKCIVAAGAGHSIQRDDPKSIVRAALEPLESL